MPAMPIADSRPPMVVGIRHTSSATSTVIATGSARPARRTLKRENGSSVTVASRNTMVSAASRMVSAISLGVFWRFAPSTSAIMRSRKVSPGIGGDAHDDPVGQHARAAGHGAAVAAGLAHDRRRFAGDGALVDRGDAFDDLAVGRDQLDPASSPRKHGRSGRVMGSIPSAIWPRNHRQMVGDRTERQRRHERSAGRPTTSTMAISITTNSGPGSGRSPAVAGDPYFLAARLPAIASTGTMTKKRPIHIATESRPL
jgi:hypothetical protein